jgi:cell division cycle 14
MNTKESDKLVEVLPNRLYWYSDTSPPVGVTRGFYFCVDKQLKYFPYFFDFGPLNIGQVLKFIAELEKLLNNSKLSTNAIFHFTSLDPAERLNAAFLMGCYMVA